MSFAQPSASRFPVETRSRAKLTESDVINIFARRRSFPAFFIASEYGVSEKAVRDIWSGRTWSKETWHLEPSRVMRFKRIGRPKGSKDLQPRKKRSNLLQARNDTVKDSHPNMHRGAVQCSSARICDSQPDKRSSCQVAAELNDRG